MKYFVTGGTGFIGREVVRQLREASHEVTALVRQPARAVRLVDIGAACHPGDVTDKDSMRAGMRGADGVFHIAGWYKLGVGRVPEATAINVTGTRNVLELMQDLAIPKGVYTSTVAVFSDTHGETVNETYRYDGPHLTEYDRTKWLGHYDVALPMIARGLPLVIVQPGVVYGPGDTSPIRQALVQYLQGKLRFVPARTAYCWAHVADIARGHLLAMEKGKPGQSYILAGPSHTLVEAFEMAANITGIAAPRWRVRPTIFKLMASLMRLAGAVVPLPESFHPEVLRSLAGVTYLGDSSLARRELGFNPRPLEAGLKETLGYEMELLGMTKAGTSNIQG